MASPTALLSLLLLLVSATTITAATLNVTDVLARGQQYGTFIRLFVSAQLDSQLATQLNNTKDGFTIFAPSDNAFTSLKAGQLNSLSQQEQVELVQFHVLTKFYTYETFQTASNPIRTMAGGDFLVNVTSAPGSQQVNVSTGVVNVQLRNAVNVTFPLAVYSVDTVLLPEKLFGNKSAAPPAEAPAAGAGATAKPDGGAAAPAKNGSADTASSTSGAEAVFVGGAWRVAAAVAAGVAGSLFF